MLLSLACFSLFPAASPIPRSVSREGSESAAGQAVYAHARSDGRRDGARRDGDDVGVVER